MMMSLGDELGGPERAKAMITAQGDLAHPEIHRGAVQEDRHVSRYRTSILPCPPSILPIRTTPPSNIKTN